MTNSNVVRKKILVLDDDPLSHLIITETFKNDFDLIFTLHTKIALELSSKISFDGFMIDYYLGNEDQTGVEVLAKIKPLALNTNAIYIAITSSIHPTIRKKIVDAGYNFLCQKPILREELMELFK